MAKKSSKVVTVSLRPAKSKKRAARVKRAVTTSQEVTAVGKALRALGGIGGSAIGGYFGAPVTGGTVGTGLGAALSRWLGMGDYSVTSNSLVKQFGASGTIPSMHKDGQTVIVRHKEFLTEIRGAQTFTVRNSLAINPGLSTTFPWLSGIASQYSEYKIRGMVYHYVPTSGNAVSGTNAALGSVMIQTSYRATEASPTSKMEMLNEYWASESKPSEEFCHPIECDPRENPFNIQYVRAGALPSSENQLMYDLGKTTVAVSGQQADNNVLGDLWVTYEIELRKPVLTNANNADIFSYGGRSVTGLNSGNPFGNTGSFTESFNSFPVPVTVTNNTITFGAGLTGTFSMQVFYQACTAFDCNNYAITGGTLVTTIGGASSIGSKYSSGSGMASNSCWFTVSDPTQSCSITASLITLTAATVVRVYITEANPSVVII